MSEILLIDAEQPFAQQLVDALTGTGFTVAQLEDGKEGLEYARNNKPALIVLCVELPKMSGYSICNKLKKDAELKTIPLVITSSEATPETFAQHKKLKTRAEDYLIKPFEPPELLEKIGNLIEMPTSSPPTPPAPPEDELASFEAIDELGGDDILSDDEVELGDQELDELAVDADDALASLGEGLDDADDDLLGDGALAGLGDDDDVLAGFGDDDLNAAALDLGESGDDDGLGDLDDGLSLGDEGLGDALDDDALNDALGDESLNGANHAASGDDDLDLGGAVDADNALEDFDDAFENMAPLGEDASPPADVAIQPAASSAGESDSVVGADFAQLSALRRENGDLQARVSELEARLKGAEDAAEASKNALSQTKSTSSSSARDVLNLKEQLMSKDKELMALKDENFAKEKSAVEIQEEVESIRGELDAKTAQIANKDAELASATTRLQAVSKERDDLEKQVNDHLGKAQADAERLKGEVESKSAALAALKTEMESKTAEIDAAMQTAEEAEDRLVAAYKRLEAEETVRAKAKEAAQIALALLSGDVDPANGATSESAGARPDA